MELRAERLTGGCVGGVVDAADDAAQRYFPGLFFEFIPALREQVAQHQREYPGEGGVLPMASI